MKQKEIANLRNMSVEGLKSELSQTREKRFGMSFKRNSSPLANPLELRVLRKKIAIIETIIREKELEASQKKDK
jgi:large subunit ribosomal protein L29